MSGGCPFALDVFAEPSAPDDPGAQIDFPLMPEGEAVDMGHAPDGTPLFDPGS